MAIVFARKTNEDPLLTLNNDRKNILRQSPPTFFLKLLEFVFHSHSHGVYPPLLHGPKTTSSGEDDSYDHHGNCRLREDEDEDKSDVFRRRHVESVFTF